MVRIVSTRCLPDSYRGSDIYGDHLADYGEFDFSVSERLPSPMVTTARDVRKKYLENLERKKAMNRERVRRHRAKKKMTKIKV